MAYPLTALLALYVAALLPLACAPQRPPTHERATTPPLDSGFYRGFTFAHEAYDGQRGYGGPTVYASLDSLLRLGTDAVAIVPYTWLRDPGTPRDFPVAERVGTERDEAVIHAVHAAHERGMRVLLKPQIWVGGGHWPGDIGFDAAADWAAFFEDYRAWLMHYAQLAEAQGVDALCIGTELGQVTLRHPGFWRKLIAEVRGVYGGKLTYAANWGEEFEGITFWDALDVVGCNGYYPLSQNPDATDEELYAGAKAWLVRANNVAAAAGRPLWLTEIGYRSVEQAWRNPHAAADGRAPSQACQRRCFAALFAATAEAPTLEGMFIWKWPSYLGHGFTPDAQPDRGEGPVGFAPGGKEAAAVVAAYYRGAP